MVDKVILLSLLVANVLPNPIDEFQYSPDELAEPEYLDQLLAEKRYEEYSKLLDLPNSRLCHPRHENSTGHPMFNEGLFLGDIVLNPRMEEKARQGANFKNYPHWKWNTKVVPYVISSQYNSRDRTKIQNGINKWNSEIGKCIRFAPRGNEAGYAQIAPGQGCFATIGRTGRQQTITLDPNGCMEVGTILHEMEHCIGFTHEHNRYDRDTYVHVLDGNIPGSWKREYIKEPQSKFEVQGPYDYYSVMHYPYNVPQSNKPAFQIKKSGIDKNRLGQTSGFTSTDKNKIKRLYGC